MPKIIELARTNLIKADITATFQDIAVLMIENNVGSVVIVDGEITGFIDDKTILRILSKNKNPLDLPINKVLTKFPKINQNDKVLDTWEKIKENEIERYGVTDDNGKIIGIVRKRTINDFRVTLLKKQLNIEDF